MTAESVAIAHFPIPAKCIMHDLMEPSSCSSVSDLNNVSLNVSHPRETIVQTCSIEADTLIDIPLLTTESA